MQNADKTGKILVIDDEPFLRQTLVVILQRDGHKVTSAADGKEALERVQKDTFDLAFLDLKLPDISGIDLLPKLHQADGELPVLILTAHATLDSAIEAVRKGARDYLLKPIDPPAILERVGQIMAERQEPERRRAILSKVQELLTELQGENEPKPELAQIPAIQEKEESDRFIRCGKLVVDLHTRHLSIEEKVVSLPPSSFDYLVTLMRHCPQAVTFERLVKESQGYDLSRIEARDMTRWHIHTIRKVVEPDPSDPQYIITVRDTGYRLVT